MNRSLGRWIFRAAAAYAVPVVMRKLQQRKDGPGYAGQPGSGGRRPRGFGAPGRFRGR